MKTIEHTLRATTLREAKRIIEDAGIDNSEILGAIDREIEWHEMEIRMAAAMSKGPQAIRQGVTVRFQNGLDRTLAGLILERQGMKGLYRQLLDEDGRSLKFADAATAQQALDIINQHNLVKIAAEIGK